MAGSVTDCITLMSVVWWFGCQSALAIAKLVFQIYIITIKPCFRCDLVMSSGGRESLIFGFSYLLCFASGSCIISGTAS